MLSAAELQQTHDQLQQLSSSSLTTAQQRNRRRELRQILKAHNYATTYPPFESLPHLIHFVNHTTPDTLLNELLHTATTSSVFLLDTESDCIYRQPNTPTLIQIQIVSSDRQSSILLIETNFLPHRNQPKFLLMQELFQRIFTIGNNIYIWGSSDELLPFIIFDLFTRAQITNLQFIDLQAEFKHFWTQQHPHNSNQSSHLCICEPCIGKLPSELWSLQDSVAYTLKEYLSKTSRNHKFGHGLDPNLSHSTSNENNYQTQLIHYVTNDCLSMQRIIIYMKSHDYQLPYLITTPDQFDTVDLNPTSPIEVIRSSTPSLSINLDPPTQSDSTILDVPSESTSIPTTSHANLSAQQRHFIHNRACTIKQRARKNTYTITKRNIDLRFRIRDIKFILTTLRIPYTAVNAPTSKLTGKRSLYIGFTDNNNLHQYEHRLQSLFDSHHYNQFRRGYHKYSAHS